MLIFNIQYASSTIHTSQVRVETQIKHPKIDKFQKTIIDGDGDDFIHTAIRSAVPWRRGALVHYTTTPQTVTTLA